MSNSMGISCFVKRGSTGNTLTGTEDQSWQFDVGDCNVQICFNKPYPAYPVKYHSFGTTKVWLEGCLYGNAPAELSHEMEILLQQGQTEAFKKLLQANTGEFWAVIVHNDQLEFINDKLARLPVYYCITESFIFTGRSIASLKEAGSQLSLAPLAALEYIWVGYTLADKTLYHNVRRLQPGSNKAISFSNFTIRDVEKPFTFNFDNNEKLSDLKNYNARAVELFKQGCHKIKATIGDNPAIMSMSAGQDSRTAAFGLADVGLNLKGAIYKNSDSAHEIELAYQLSRILGLGLATYQLEKPVQADFEQLLAIKNGHNYLGMAFILPFLKQLQNDFSTNSFYITGDGGDKLLPFIGEHHLQGMSADEEVERIIRRLSTTPFYLLKQLLSNDSLDAIRQSVYNQLKSYDEVTSMGRIVHFITYERSVKLLFEGEDRNRFFFWSTTPFYDVEFFEHCMKLPQKYKSGLKFYKQFQQQLNPALMTIPDTTGQRLNSGKYYFRTLLNERVRSANPELKQKLRSIINKGLALDEVLIQDLENLDFPAEIKDVFLTDGLKNFAAKANSEHYYHLKTLSEL